MKTALKAKWVAALRSGKYTQTREGTLKTGYAEFPAFCCLGVLVEISPAVQGRQGSGDSYLSDPALTYAGLTDEQQLKLSVLNDDKDYGFKRIATYIEKHI